MSINNKRPSTTHFSPNSGPSGPKLDINSQMETLISELVQFGEANKIDKDPLVRMMVMLTTIVQVQQQTIQQQLARIDKICQKFEQNAMPQSTTTFDHEADERAHCLVISNLPEAEDHEATERATADRLTACKILNACGVEALPVNAYRMGKKGDRPRLLKLEMPTKYHARQLLKNKKNLTGSSNFSKIKIRPSLSKSELEQRKLLIIECNTQNKLFPDKHFVVYANHVLPKSEIQAFKSNSQ